MNQLYFFVSLFVNTYKRHSIPYDNKHKEIEKMMAPCVLTAILAQGHITGAAHGSIPFPLLILPHTTLCW